MLIFIIYLEELWNMEYYGRKKEKNIMELLKKYFIEEKEIQNKHFIHFKIHTLYKAFMKRLVILVVQHP